MNAARELVAGDAGEQQEEQIDEHTLAASTADARHRNRVAATSEDEQRARFLYGSARRLDHDERRHRRERGAPGGRWLTVDCNLCRRRIVLRGVPFLEHETEAGRVRRAFIADRAKVAAFVARHRGHELATSGIDPAVVTAGQLVLAAVESFKQRPRAAEGW